MKWKAAKEAFLLGKFYEQLQHLYACDEAECERQAQRFAQALDSFASLFGEEREVAVFSAPGRTEVGGNHTDHQRGHVLAASVNLDILGVVSKNGTDKIRIKSQGYPQDEVDLNDLSMHPAEQNSSRALVRGIAAKFQELGAKLEGFDVYMTSQVLSGSGLSSSAAFEVLVGNIFNALFYDRKAAPMQIAQIGQYAENVYFGKPSGLLDQAASSIGGFVAIDFKDKAHPDAQQVRFDFSKSGYALCVLDTHASHADLTPDYAAIPEEMRSVAAYFGKEVLSEVAEETFYAAIPELRRAVGDRPVLRAMHFYAEDRRAKEEADALNGDHFARFLQLVRESGNSSFMFLQNIYSAAHYEQQAVSVALGLCAHFAGRLPDPNAMAWRVHGGGFAGTVQAFVPERYVSAFANEMDAYLGEGSCHILRVRPVGGMQIVK